ncbi:hypothetical protein D3C76_812750 [compost metagenome]
MTTEIDPSGDSAGGAPIDIFAPAKMESTQDLPPQRQSVQDPFDPCRCWKGLEFKRWVVTVECGPYKRKKPAYQAQFYPLARDKAGAIEQAKRSIYKRLRNPSFAARLAHPGRDLGMKLTDSREPSAASAAQPVRPWGEWCVACRCGYRDDVEAFTRTPAGVELPKREYQCPKCFRAWRIEADGEGWTTPEGRFIAPQLRCVAILPRC